MTLNRRDIIAGVAASPLLLSPAAALAQTPIPQMDNDARRPRAVARLVPERFDDLIWENDRVAHRIYGRALQAAEPPSGSGVDVWVKRVRWPFMARQIATGAYHVDHGEGLDYYSVGQSRGAGGLGVWHDDKLWTSRNFARHQILESGEATARFAVEYDPWPVDVVRKVWERREVALPLGSSFSRITTTLHSDTPEPLVIGIGIAKRRGPTGSGILVQDKDAGFMSFWEPDDPDHGSLGIAVTIDPSRVIGFTADADNHLMLVSVRPGRPFTYSMGSAWSRGLDFADPTAWLAHVRAHAAA